MLAEHFDVDELALDEPGAPSWNVAPRAEVLTIVEREDGPPAGPDAVGARAVVGGRSRRRGPDDQRPGRDACSRSRRSAPRWSAGAASSRPTASTSGSGSVAQAADVHPRPLGRAARVRRPLGGVARRRRRRRAVAAQLHDRHHGRQRDGGAGARPDAGDARRRRVGSLARPRRHRRCRGRRPPASGARRSARALAGEPTRQQRRATTTSG